MKITRLKLPGRIGRQVLFLLLLLLSSQFVNAQSPVAGTVKDETGQPLPGVTVQIKGKTAAVGTDVNGTFTISASKTDVLHISFVGYVAKDILVGDQTKLSVSLEPEAKNLDEVIVTGYTKQSKHDVTGAASTVKGSVIQQTPVTSLEGALEGRVAGVVVDGQGGPGNTASIRIRGIGTLGDNDPLYVIDGVQVRIGPASEDISNLLNPNDIESVTVLKDPSLTGLYGSRGDNGVIVITTKSGKIGAPQLQYDGYVGYENPKNLPKTITPQQQADALYASYKNSGVAIPTSVSSFYGTGTTPVLPDYIIENDNGSGNIGVSTGNALANPSLYNQDNYRILKANKTGTNWWDVLFNPSLTQNHNLSLSGATDKSNYAVTMGYLNDKGTLLNSYFQRYSFRVNTQFKIKPWLRFGENIEASFTSQNTTNRGATNDIQELYMLSPLLPQYDIQGNVSGTNHALILGNTGNPFNDRVNSKTNKSYAQSIVGSAYGEADIIKGLTYTNQIGFQLYPTEYHGYSPVQPQEPIPGTTNIFTEGGDYTTDWRWLNKLSYTTTINKVHDISAFVGYEASENVERSYGGEAYGILYPSVNTEYLGSGTSFPGIPVFGGGDKSTSLSTFGNITYSYMDKYLFTATGRRDGSSKFGPDNVYGNFGALSAGWRISQENFLKNVTWLSDLKLRASYGTSGNDEIPSSAYLSLLETGTFGNYDLGGTNTTSLNGYYLYQAGNPTLQWEQNKTTNIGFDAAFFHNSLSASFNWFNRATNKLLYAPPTPGTLGSAISPLENIMNFTNKGIELELNYNNHFGDVKYSMGFNIATDKNNINYIDGLPGAFFQQGVIGSNGANYLNRDEVGHSVGEFYGYVYEGLYRSPSDVTSHATEDALGITSANALGHVMYKDRTGDGKVDPSDETYLGSPIPKFTYGYNLDVNYKNLDIGIFFQGSYGNKIYNYAKELQLYPNANGTGVGGLVQGALDTWSPTNPNATLPIFAQNSTAQDIQPSSFFIESGSYLRLKTATVGYTFNKLKGIKKLRVYAQAFNLLTITKYSGMDPEVNDGTPNNMGIDYGTAYPITQKFLIGVNLGL
ncbi:TonB-dependent receptor [uncultured Mucilaginibacter sp.]|uniref:SusC/RagA family TonB-linked outer membrane protein n=1 Tax=uncultured Mucilaginibacter sp. TaxID=797541 RepID=UPI0025EAD260|nr:TonB-dependent receptor [uncultured Mucilaginibacter sp.]